MTAATAKPDGRPKLREVRLRLVQNGGVSLAICIGGAERVNDKLRRASDRETFPQDAATRAFAGGCWGSCGSESWSM